MWYTRIDFSERGALMKSILNYLETSAERFPDKTAVIEPEATCTYRVLRDDAKTIGMHLSDVFSQNEPIVIFKEKSILTLKAMLGAAYAGCHYVMVDPSQPDERVSLILDVLKTKTVLADESEHARLHHLGMDLKLIDPKDLLSEIHREEVLAERYEKQISTDPLYILFTSGSTGMPKGVVVSHGSVIDFINTFTEVFAIDETDIMGNQAPFDFDVSVKDIYSCLKTGATLQLIPKTYFSNPMLLLDYLVDEKTTILVWAVSALCILTTFKALDYRKPVSLRKIMFSGERMPVRHLKMWRKALPETVFVNLYGPTEITCNCSYYVLDQNKDYDDELPIGKPFINDRIILLDEEDQLIEKSGETGEICVVGASLSLGYYNNPTQTSKAFVQNPLNPNYRELIYRTGDLGYYNEDGLLCIKGRKDFQIKHMGHRIELEEIEKKMEENEKVVRACCIYHEKKYKIFGIYEGDIDVKELLDYLESKLPHYMIPNTFMQVESIPLSKNGKVNRAQLKLEVGIQ